MKTSRSKQKRIRPISKVRAVQMRKYSKLKKAFLIEYPFCAVAEEILGKRIRATEVHHMRGRVGKLLLDQEHWLPVSRWGHNWIHNHQQKARDHGWICEKGHWNQRQNP